MAEKEKKAGGDVQVKEGAAAVDHLTALGKYGGFTLLETSVEGIQNMNPERKARKRIFLQEETKKVDKELLKKRLTLWLALIQDSETVPEMAEKCQAQIEKAAQLLTKNLGSAINKTRDLERNYRSVALFYKNSESDKIKNVSIMNAEMDQLNDLDNTTFIDAVSEELKANFDRLDLRDHYSLMVIPGYLGSKKVVEKWGKMAFENKVMLLTDFEDMDAPDDVMDLFESADLASGDLFLSNVIMSCNWLAGREQYTDIGEEDGLFVPPSSALAGKIYKTLMSQVTAGKKFGGMNEVDGVRFPLKKSELSNLERMGLVPMVNEYGKVMAFSAKTLFNGDNIGLQTYSVVRVFDYVTKVLIDFLNRRAFENFDSKNKENIQEQIVKFLTSVKGPGKLIEKFQIKRFQQDKSDKTKVHLDIHITPYFPAKNFMIRLGGTKGDDSEMAAWDAEYAQQ